MTDLQDRPIEAALRAPVEPEEELGFNAPRMVGLFALLGFLAFIGGWQLLVIVGAFVIFLMIHEFGHYSVAKWSGMKVTEYFIGFGPRVFAFKRGEVTYGLKAIPAGAYVRIVGMNNLEDVDPEDEPRTYRQASWHKRMLTIAAGPLSHFAIALVLGFGLLFTIGQASETEWEVGQVVPFGAAETIGVEEGDRIVSIGGDTTANFTQLAEVVSSNRGQEVDVVIARPTLDGNGDSVFGSDYNDETIPTVLGEVLTDRGAGFVRQLGKRGEHETGLDGKKIFVLDENGKPIDRISGLYDGDMVRSVGGTPVTTYEEFLEAAQPFVGGQVEVEVVYGRELHTELITINRLEQDPVVAARGFLGIGREDFREARPVLDSATGSAEIVWETTSLIAVEMPKRLATRAGVLGLFGFSSETDVEPEISAGSDLTELRPISVDENRLVSIIGAVRIARQLVDTGWAEVVGFLLLINLSFGILNALPMLPLDGGHMVMATYERIRSFGGERYYADAAKLLPVTYAVIMLFMLIGGIAMVRDVIDPIVIPS